MFGPRFHAVSHPFRLYFSVSRFQSAVGFRLGREGDGEREPKRVIVPIRCVCANPDSIRPFRFQLEVGAAIRHGDSIDDVIRGRWLIFVVPHKAPPVIISAAHCDPRRAFLGSHPMTGSGHYSVTLPSFLLCPCGLSAFASVDALPSSFYFSDPRSTSSCGADSIKFIALAASRNFNHHIAKKREKGTGLERLATSAS